MAHKPRLSVKTRLIITIAISFAFFVAEITGKGQSPSYILFSEN